MPRVRWHHCLNPPPDYAAHAREVEARFREEEGLVRSVEVLYGLGPVMEITVETELENAQLSRLARVAEGLLENSHTTGAGPTTVWYTADQRRALQEPRPA